MEYTQKELLDQVKTLMTSILSEVSELEQKLYELENKVRQSNGVEPEAISISPDDFTTVPEDIPDLSVPEDVAVAAEPVSVPVEEAPVTVPPMEDVPFSEEVPAEDAPVEEIASVDGTTVENILVEEASVEEPSVKNEEAVPDSLFGNEFEDSFANAARQMHKKSILEAAESANRKAVLDTMTDRCAWKTDMPGSEVHDIRSAISLNDRVLFINNLFSEDVVLFQKVMEMVNNAGSLEEVEDFITANFPDWNMGSDIVYRFMMAVRRKVR